jgi:hypothetical protein
MVNGGLIEHAAEMLFNCKGNNVREYVFSLEMLSHKIGIEGPDVSGEVSVLSQWAYDMDCTLWRKLSRQLSLSVHIIFGAKSHKGTRSGKFRAALTTK